MNNRIEWIDALKGFAILTVVIGHCVTDCISSRTFPEHAYFLQALNDFIYSFHMPLFFMISGYVFYLTKSYRKYKTKVLDFTMIYVIWCMFTWLSKFFMAKDVNNPVNVMDLISIIYKPIMVYWYLYVLIFMYIIVSYMKWHEVNIGLLVCASIVAVVTKIAHFDIGIINNIAYYLYFFLVGGILYQKNIVDKIQKKYLILGISLIIVNSLLYLCFQQTNHTYISIKGFVLANLVSAVCFKIFTEIKHKNSFLAILGTNTLQIYVMHCFFTGGLRILFKHIGISNITLYFILGILLGVVVPIICAKICSKSPYLNFVFEPLGSLRKIGVVKN